MCGDVLFALAINARDARAHVSNRIMNDWLYFFLVLVGMVCATVFTRSAFLLLPTRWQLPPAAIAALRYAPIAAIAAIVTPELIAWRPGQTSAANPELFNPKLLAALLACCVHWRFANMLLTIVSGMGAFWLLRYALSTGLIS
jgi:branched-subunit amino acid transport protein